FRQTLYEELIAPRRILLHQQVARALEEIYTNRLEEHAVELAEHFSYSSDAADLEKAVSYGEMAAKRATDVYAYGEAVRLLEQALKVHEILDPDDKARRCDLLLDLCDALYLVVDTRRIIEIEAPAAFDMAESLGDGSRAVRACIPAIFSIIVEQAMFSSPEAGEWTERINRYAKPGTVEKVYADMVLGGWKAWTGDRKSGLAILNQALDLARRIGDQQALWITAGSLLLNLSEPQDIKQRMRLGEELWAGSHAGLNVVTSYALYWIIWASLMMGRRKFAEEVLSELRTIAERTGQITPRLMSASVDTALAVMDGCLEEAMDMAKSMRARGEEAGVSTLAHVLASPGHRAQLYLGTSLETIGREIPLGPMEEIIVPYLAQAFLGQKEEVSEILEKNVVNRPGIGTIDDVTMVWIDTLYLEAAILAGHRQAAELLLKRYSGTGLCSADYYVTCIPRHMGGAVALLGRYDEARKYYQEAIKVCTEMSFRPELALSRLQLAELLLERYPNEKKEALEHLDFAIKEFREMKMQPSLERALRHKDILKA
ncbi:MAG TPA: tetratricopeptide repeat protein, partial [Dehalococcoidia bacterium]|nr:tetratricopeptide repeat protein [Dehalococcoidia bacterium]